jgi:nucleoside-diphosphate-sugar epimerase
MVRIEHDIWGRFPTSETSALQIVESAGRRNPWRCCLFLRGGLFYGPGTGIDDEWFSRARAGKLRLPGDGTSYVSLIHIADMAEATVVAINRWPGGFEPHMEGSAEWFGARSAAASRTANAPRS